MNKRIVVCCSCGCYRKANATYSQKPPREKTLASLKQRGFKLDHGHCPKCQD